MVLFETDAIQQTNRVARQGPPVITRRLDTARRMDLILGQAQYGMADLRRYVCIAISENNNTYM